jgi:hypothetical protein
MDKIFARSWQNLYAYVISTVCFITLLINRYKDQCKNILLVIGIIFGVFLEPDEHF